MYYNNNNNIVAYTYVALCFFQIEFLLFGGHLRQISISDVWRSNAYITIIVIITIILLFSRSASRVFFFDRINRT